MEQMLDLDEDYFEEPTDEEIMETIFESIIKNTEVAAGTLAVKFFSDLAHVKMRLDDLVSKGLLEEFSGSYKVNWETYEIRKVKTDEKFIRTDS